MPRYSALSEALWSGEENSDWSRFQQKMLLQLDRYEALDYNYSESAFTPVIDLNFDKNSGNIVVELSRELDLFPLHYTLDGEDPTGTSFAYNEVFIIEPGQMLKANTLRFGKPFGYTALLEDIPNLATGKTVSYNTSWEEAYSGAKEATLTDGQLASKRGDHSNWQGFQKKDLDVIVDLGEEMPVSEVWIRFFQHAGMTRVMLPVSVEVLGSRGGKTFESLGIMDLTTDTSHEAMIKKIRIKFSTQSLRYIRLKALNPDVLFPGHPWEGMDAWIFSDELGVK